MATAKMITTITEKISTSGPGTPQLDALNGILRTAKTSCISQTGFLTEALSQYNQIRSLLNSASCTVHWSTFDFAGRIAMGDFMDDSMTELLGTNPSAALTKANNLINSACSMINGLMNFVNMMKNFMLQIYSLLDFLKGIGDFDIDCNFGDLVTLLSQTPNFSPSTSFPSYMEGHLRKTERIIGKMYGNKSNGTRNIKALNEVQLTRYPTENISLADILKYSKVNIDSAEYDPDFGYMYDAGVRYDQELVDMQSRLVNALVAEAGDIGTSELQTQGFCSISGNDTKEACLAAGGIWTLNDDISKTVKKVPRTWYVESDIDFMNLDILAGDNVEDKRNGTLYIKTHEIIPELFSDVMIQGWANHVAPFNFILDNKSKKGDNSFITLQDIPNLEKILIRAKTDYDNSIYKKTITIAKYTDSLSRLAETGETPSVIQDYLTFMNSYDLRTVNLYTLYEILDNNPNKIGRLKWIIEAGKDAIANKTNSFTKNDGINGNITLTFPLSSYDYENIKNNDINNSNEFISTDISKINSFNYHIKQFYDEFKNFDEFITNLTEKITEMDSKYNDFIIKNSLSDALYYGTKKSYDYPGKNIIRIGDGKVYLAFSNPHIQITNEVSENPSLNLFHGDVWQDSTTHKVYMYLRLLGSTSSTFTYEWKEIGSTVQIFRDLNEDPINVTLTLDASVFSNIDNKTNTYSSNDGIDPAATWNEYQSWTNIGDIWLDSSDSALGIRQKVYSYNGTNFVWTPLLSNNPPIIAPVVINTAEDTAITGNMLNGVFDIDGDSFYLDSIKINGTEISTNPNLASVDVHISGFGLLKLIGNKGDYYFYPDQNVNGSFSFSYKVIDSKGASSVSLWTIYITPVNDRPVISGPINVVYSADVLTTQSINLLQNASDPENDELFVSDIECLTDNDKAGQSGIEKYFTTSNILNVLPSYYKDILKRSETEIINYTYSITDGYSPKAFTGLTISITGINHAPVLNEVIKNYNFFADVNSTDILLSDLATDFDGDILNISDYVKFTDPKNSLSANVTKFVINPSKYYNVLKRGEVQNISANYKANDLNGGFSDLGTLNFKITGVNHAPEITQDYGVSFIKTDASSNIDMLKYAIDFDDDVLLVEPNSISITGDDAGIAINNNIITVTPSSYSTITNPEIITIFFKVKDEMNVESNLGKIIITINPQ